MSEQELIQAGISALKANDKGRAVLIFSQFVRQYPHSEGGWYLLGMSIDDAQKRAYCFERVLEINPNNPDAKKQLALLSPPEPAPPAPVITPPEPPLLHVPAFLESQAEQQEIPEDSQPETPVKAPKRKQKNNNAILIATISGLCILACTALVAFNLLAGRLTSPVSAPPVLDPTSTSIPITSDSAAITSTPPPATPLATAAPTLAYTPAYESAPCMFEAPPGVRVSCGYAIVPENRTSSSGRTLRLAVAVFHSTSQNPALDPILFLQGGPGGQAVQLSADGYSVLVEPFISTRDYITFDQRGTGYSDPQMDCDELEKVHRQDIYGSIAPESRELVYQNAFLDCGGRLHAQGIDLSAYSTVESAADLRDIVRLLGYEKVNLYGVSYGTRLSLVTMRNHPEVVRSAILDSVVPVESNVIEEYPRSVDSALSQMFTSCAADPECAGAYPDLKEVFWALIQELDANPITLTTSAYPMGTVTETVDGSYLLSVTTGLLRSPGFIITAPQTIYRVKNGDYSTLIAAQYSLPYEFEGISPGLYISMMCREHVLDSTPEELSLISEKVGVEEKVFRPFYGDFGDMFSGCRNWGIPGPNLGEKDAVVSDIPSLVIEGSFDPATPPFYGKQVAERLANSFYYEFPAMGHVPTTDDACALKIALDFIANPLLRPDDSCLAVSSPADFLVPYTGTPALELNRERISGVTVDVPGDWELTIDGFFWRGASVFDITQVTAFRSDITAQDLVDYFSSSLNGYRGLDGPPAEAGTRRANGYEWIFYYATSNQRPVDIAIAEDGDSSLVIVLFSHPDEHDALYRTVFLPMVDSAR